VGVMYQCGEWAKNGRVQAVEGRVIVMRGVLFSGVVNYYVHSHNVVRGCRRIGL
jgi:hypothetical protein